MARPPLQGRDNRRIAAPAAVVWDIIEDTGRLPSWVPMVTQVDAAPGQREHVGATRTCQVHTMGRRGQITERCTELVPQRSAFYVVAHDSLGFSRLVDDFSFAITAEAHDDAATTVTLSSHYRPRGLPGRLANLLVLRRQLQRARRRMLAGLARLAEQPTLARP
ncbi:MAG TPA: SRPBCC family protein [Pseudonocardiaceae bacterium]|jgi:uncharacterized protein YndB with AHSA1/START domain